MKKLFVLSALLSGALTAGINKMPLTIKDINSNAYNEYAIIYTTITLNPKDADKASDDDRQPRIDREIVGYIRGTEEPEFGKYRILSANRAITIPQQQISKDHEKEIAVLTSKLAGKLGNAIATGFDKKELGKKIEASAEITGAIAEWGLQVAAEKLSEFYGIDETKLNLIEIIPTKYYKVADNDITITEAFTQDFERFMQLKKEYKEIVQDWNKDIREYQQANDDCDASLETNIKQCEKAERLWKDKYENLLLKKTAIEEQTKNLALQRFAIMPSFREPGNGCSKITSTGPWGITINTYVGARQTNAFNVDYCVRNPDSRDQNISIEIRGDRRDKDNRYIAGGLVFKADGQTVSLPRNIGQTEPRWDSQISNQFNWYDTMLTKEDSGTIKDYLVPFDVLELKKEAAELYRKKRTERFEKLLADIDKYGDKFNSGDSDDEELVEERNPEKPKKDGDSKKSPLEEKKDELKKAIANSINQAFVDKKMLSKRIDPASFNDTFAKVNQFITENLPRDDRQLTQTFMQAVQETSRILKDFITMINRAVVATEAKRWDDVRAVIKELEQAKFKAQLADAVSTVKSLDFGPKEAKKAAIKEIITSVETVLATKDNVANLKAEFQTKQFEN